MDLRRIALFAPLLACKPPTSVADSPSIDEPRVIVEQPGEPPLCDLVVQDAPTFEVQDHVDWVEPLFDPKLATPAELASMHLDTDRARASLCSKTYDDSGGVLSCTDEGRQVLSMPTKNDVSVLIVEPTEQGLRSIEISRWRHSCRCECDSWVEVLSNDPLSVVVVEYENVTSEIHLEDDEIVHGCEEGDECQTVCLGESYGRQRLLVFDCMQMLTD